MKLPIRVRLIIWYVSIMAVVLLALTAMQCLSLYRKLYRDMRKELKEDALVFAHLYEEEVRESGAGQFDLRQALDDQAPRFQGHLQVTDLAGKVLYRSPSLGEGQIPLTDEALQEVLSQGKYYGEYSLQTGDRNIDHALVMIRLNSDKIPPFIMCAADSLELLQSRLAGVLKMSLLLIVAFLVGAVFLGNFIAQRLLVPLDRITQYTRTLTAEDLGKRLPEPRLKDELGRLAETINEMIARLDKSFSGLRQFAAEAAHELRTPLTVVKGHCQVALRSDRSVEEYRQILGTVLEQVVSTSEVIDNLLLLLRSDAGLLAMEMSPCDLKEIVQEVHELATVMAMGRGIKVSLRHDGDRFVVSGHAPSLKRAVLNIVGNAIKYNRTEGQVELHLVQRDNGVSLAVSDTGEGIAAEKIPRIFDRFYRDQGRETQEKEGAGLGLAIAKNIVGAHGGKIEVTSQPEKGSCFTIWLPAGRPQPPIPP